ncbi:MAG: hypothetical protein HC905_00070 [Bacteroidales bacterium]|nr:hypothetical protein [Bacteroidales bacterium]
MAIIALISQTLPMFGQQNNSLYFMDRIPQSIQLNPALQPGCIVYLGVPGISGIEVNGGNNALSLKNILIQNDDIGKLVTPFYSKEITRQTLDKLNKNNVFYAGSQIDIASFGFKIMDSYVSFLVADKVNVNTIIPKSLFEFIYDPIDVGKTFNIENLRINASYYREYSVGYSQKINNKLYVWCKEEIFFWQSKYYQQARWI